MRGELIFIVEDDDFFGYVVETYIKENIEKGNIKSMVNCTIERYKSVEECRKNLYKQPSVLITDFELKNKFNGAHLALSAHKEAPSCKCIIMSSNPENEEYCQELGLENFFVKSRDNLYIMKDIILQQDAFIKSFEMPFEDKNAKVMIFGASFILLIALIELITTLLE